MLADILGASCRPAVAKSPAAHLKPTERKALALDVIQGGKVTDVARAAAVSRKFVYRQTTMAYQAIDDAFKPDAQGGDQVLFYVPVTRQLIRQIVLALVLRCHASFRGIIAFLDDVFGYSISIGTVHNMVHAAIDQARFVNASIPLGDVAVGCHDEIYQADKPVLVGIDAASTYCYLLADAEACDTTTWGCHLLDAKDVGLSPQYVVADQGKAQRAGLAEAFPGTPCYADVFHMQRDLSDAIRYYENRLATAVTEREKIEGKMETLRRRGKNRNPLSRSLGRAREKERSLRGLVDDLRLLVGWLADDVLAIHGPSVEERATLYDFIVAELRNRETGRGKVMAMRQRLENIKDDLLGFVTVIDAKLEEIAREHSLPKDLLYEMAVMLGRSDDDPRRYEMEAALRRTLRGDFHAVAAAVTDALTATPRASSIVENLNSILRGYFFLRRDVGGGYLDLLRFYLNHRVIERSRRAERCGHTPREVLTGASHAHWLELLGFTRLPACS